MTADSAPKLAVSVPEAAAIMSLAESTVWEEVGAGRLRSFKVGKRRLIRVASIAAYLEQRELIGMSKRNGLRSIAPAQQPAAREGAR